MNVVNVLNAIRTNASEEYQNRIPTATKENFNTISQQINTYKVLQNEFINVLCNKIGATYVHNKLLNNPLSILKTGAMPLGLTKEEIYTNVAKDQGKSDGTKLLQKEIGQTAVAYHNMNRESTYKVSISNIELKRAFTSMQSLGDFIQSKLNSLYSGDYYDEFILMKKAISSAYNDGKILSVHTPEITNDIQTSRQFIKSVKNVSKNFQLPTTLYNGYNLKNKDANFVTWVNSPNDKVLIARTDITTSLDVDVLANAMNMSKADLTERTIEIDAFPNADNLQAILCDKALFQFYDNELSFENFRNPDGRFTTFYLNHFETLSLSPFANAVAFTSDEVTA